MEVALRDGDHIGFTRILRCKVARVYPAGLSATGIVAIGTGDRDAGAEAEHGLHRRFQVRRGIGKCTQGRHFVGWRGDCG